MAKALTFRDEEHFFSEGRWKDWQQVEDSVGDEVEPADLDEAWGDGEGFHAVVSTGGWGVGLEVRFPFTIRDFWAAVASSEDDVWRLKTLSELRYRAEETGGVIAVQMEELLQACRLFRYPRKQSSASERAQVWGYLADWELAPVVLPGRLDEWALVYYADAEAASTFERLVVWSR